MKNLTYFLFLSVTFLVTDIVKAQQRNSGTVPGVIIDYSAASSGQYIGSPSICILSNGDYVASHDFFGPKATERSRAVTWVFLSSNKGRTWKKISEINGQFWSTLFRLDNVLYLIGTYHEYGNLIIRKSMDDGISWSDPTSDENGLLREGRYHTAPTPVIVYNGRVWRAMEHANGPSGLWARMFGAFMLSAAVNSNLLNASSWTTSEEIAFDSTFLNGEFGGWLEGNAVVDKNGNMLDILRVATKIEGKEFAAVIKVSADGKQSHFNPLTDFINFPGGSKKFSIRYDSSSGRYWTLSNYIPEAYSHLKNTGTVRNTLALCSSEDLTHWTVNKIILQHSDVEKHGFQYVDWQFAGKDIILVARTAYDDIEGGAHNYHDANFLTFHRIKKFRKQANKKVNQAIDISRASQ
ncbi:MAG: exo-alpha-sialidase [Chitinophagaceae bacterium]